MIISPEVNWRSEAAIAAQPTETHLRSSTAIAFGDGSKASAGEARNLKLETRNLLASFKLKNLKLKTKDRNFDYAQFQDSSFDYAQDPYSELLYPPRFILP